jgi:surface antigen
MMFFHQPTSAYLGKPRTNPRQRTSWQGFRTQFVEVKRENPHMGSRLIVALAIWCAGIGTIQNLAHVSATAGQPAKTPVTASSLASLITSPQTAQPAAFAPVVHAQALPSGPSGQLLPPGTMAPDRTYPNNYTRGQCTWYVAGRRQIPPNWGNAVAWYYHASASGWSVGTTPAIAAIAWTSAGPYGHVALVEQVSADGTQVYVSEMNHPIAGRVTTRWSSAKLFKYIY